MNKIIAIVVVGLIALGVTLYVSKKEPVAEPVAEEVVTVPVTPAEQMAETITPVTQ